MGKGRILEVGTRNYTKVVCNDEPGQGGACHDYSIMPVEGDNKDAFCNIKFQDGPIKEAGVNGVHHEDLIAIIIDRLEHFQKGKYACNENHVAKTKLEQALQWLGARTKKRQDKGIEGTHEV